MTTASINIEPKALVCNDVVNIPLGSNCSVAISPDDLLENPCDTIIDTMYYFITIKGIGKDGNESILASGGGKGPALRILSRPGALREWPAGFRGSAGAILVRVAL